MNPPFDPGIRLESDAWLAAGLEATIAASLILTVASALALILRRASAASRHAVWSLGLFGALLVPVVSRVVPGWLLLRGRDVVNGGTKPAADIASDSPAAPVPRANPVAQHAQGAPSELSRTDRPVAVAAGGDIGTSRVVRLGWDWVLMPWAIGALAVLARTGAGLIRLRRLVRCTTRFEGDLSRGGHEGKPGKSTSINVYHDLLELAGRLKIRRRVRLLIGGDDVMPMTWGWLRPVVLLPGSAELWPDGQRLAVLLHEFAHIRRWDCTTQAMAQLACAIYWFHPLAWVAAARMRTERERACDDLVLLEGARPSEYAGELLKLARSCRAAWGVSAWATAMARSSGLERRIRAILDPAVRRSGVSKRALLIGLMMLAAVTVPASAVRLYARQGPVDVITASRPMAAEEPKVTVDTVTKAWTKHQNHVQTAKLTWTQRMKVPARSVVIPRENPRGADLAAPPEDVTLEQATTLTIDRDRWRYTTEAHEIDRETGKYVPTKTDLVSVNGILKAYMPKSSYKYPIANINRVKPEDIPRIDTAWPPFFILRSMTVGLFKPRDYYVALSPGYVGNRPCTILRPRPNTSVQSLWVDTSRDYCLVRAAVPTEGHDLWRVDITYAHDPEHGWLPRGWKIVAGNAMGIPDYEVSAVVTELKVNMPMDPKAFELELPPGTWVRDFTKPSDLGDTTQYILLEGGKQRPITRNDRGATYQQLLRGATGKSDKK